MKLTPKLTLVFVLYAVALLASVAWLAYTSGKESLRSATVSELQSTATEKQSALNEWVEEKRTDILLLAGSPATIEITTALSAASPGTPEAQAAHDHFLMEVQPRVLGGEFLVIMLLDPDTGQVIAATEPGEEGKFKEDRPFFLKGRVDSYVQNVYYSISTQEPAMTAAAPLRSENGKLLGVLAGRLDLDEMNAIINRHPDSWETEEAFLVNTSNLFVTQPRLSSNPAVLQHGVHSEAVNFCLTHKSGTLYDLDYRGIPALIVFRWLPGQELCLIVKIDQDEALAPAYEFGGKVAVISGLALLAAILLGALFSRGITGPIRALRSGVASFGQGELDIHLPETARDELGDLAREFNRMAASIIEKDARLHEYANDLELKIWERTAALKQREERYRSYIEVTGQLGWTTNPLGEVEEDIPSWRKYTGQSEEDVKGRGWSQALHPDDLEGATLAWNHSVATRSNFEMEYRVRRYDGVYRYFLTRGLPVYKDNGEIEEWVGTCIDITERKRAEEEIANLSKFPTENPNPVLRLHNDGQIIYANKASRELLELWDCEVNDYLPEDIKNLISEVVESGRNKSVDFPCNDKVYAIILVPVSESGYVNLYGSDITERKHAEDELLASEARYRNTLDAMLEGCQIIGFDWRYLYLNDVADRHNRRPKEELLGNKYMDMWPGIESTHVFTVIRQCLEERVSQFMENEFRFPDGSQGWFELRIYPVPEGIVILSVDITERKRAEDELNRTLDELKHSNAELEQFAYVASHDLQEPLRGIAGIVQLLQIRYEGQLDSRADEYIGHIVDGTQRMQTLINDLLAYSRIGRRGDAIQSTEAGTALKAALENLDMAIVEFGASITNESLPIVRADPTQLIQLFQNLIGNAIKFRAERPPRIHIGVADTGDFWQFSVRDNGIGIEPQYFERIFLVFQRLHTRREYKGTGIGLAICKKIIERHGGRIWAESVMEQGSTFYFTLPKGE